jgi:CRP-like cAMP-binding protein
MEEIFRKQIDKIVRLTDREFDFTLSHFTEKQFKKKQVVFTQGKYIDSCYYVVSGLMALVHVNEQGKEVIFSIVNEDRWESDFTAFFTQKKTTMYLKCLEITHLLCLTLDNYNKLCREIPKMQSFFHQKSTLGFITTQQRLLSFLTTTAQKRYELLLETSPSIIQRVSKTLLAPYLGVTRETLSRLSPKKV